MIVWSERLIPILNTFWRVPHHNRLEGRMHRRSSWFGMILLLSGLLSCNPQLVRYQMRIDECAASEQADADRYATASGNGDELVWTDNRPNETLIHLRRQACLETVTVNGPDGTYSNGPYVSTGGWTYSPSNRRLAYTARGPRGVVVVIDGVEGPPFHGMRISPFFTPDGQHIMYVAIVYVELRRSVVVVDGEVQMRLRGWVDDGTTGLTSTGRWIVGVPIDEDMVQVYVDGTPASRCERDPNSSNYTNLSVVTSLTGDHYAYRCRRAAGGELVVIDGRETMLPSGWTIGDLGPASSAPHLWSPDIGFSHDGQHYWYHVVRRDSGNSGSTNGEPRIIGLYFNDEFTHLNDIRSVLEVMHLCGDIYGVLMEDSRDFLGQSLRLLGRFQCVTSIPEATEHYALVAGGQVCFSQVEPFDPQLFGCLPNGTVTYRDQPIAR